MTVETVVAPPVDGHAEASPRYRGYMLAVLTATYVVCYLDRQILGILIEPIKRDLGLSDTELGFLSGTAFALCYILFGLVMGAAADTRSRRTILGVSLVVWSGATAVCGIAQSFLQLFFARVVVGIGEAGCVPAAQSLIAAYYPPKARGSALGVFMAGSSIGTFLGFLVGGAVAAWAGWRVAFILASIPGLVLAGVVMLTIREPARLLVAGVQMSLVSTMRFGVKFLSTRKSFRWIAVSAGLGAMISYGLGTWLASFFIRYHGLGIGHTGLLLAVVFGLGGALGIWIGGRVGDRWSRRDPRGYPRLAATALIIATPCYWLAFMTPHTTVAILALIPAVVASHALSAPAFASIHGIVAPEMRGFGVAAYMFVGNLLGIGLGAFTIGLLSDVLGGRLGAEALRYSLVTVVSVGWLAAAGFFGASRSLARDWRTA